MRGIAYLVLLACSSDSVTPPVEAAAPDVQAIDSGIDVAEEPIPDAADEGEPLGPCEGNPIAAKDGTFKTSDNVSVLVRVPKTSFVPSEKHPLLMVYSPGGGDPTGTEAMTGLTPDATGRGYIVAYVEDVPPTSPTEIQKAAAAAPAVMARWCVDPLRVYMTGDSNGGSISEVVGAKTYVKVAAIAPIAAGAKASVMQTIGCSAKPLSVMQIHSKDDTLFPLSGGYGADVAKFWAQCNSCDMTPLPPLADGCIVYIACLGGVEVQYCEQTGPHGQWPNMNTSLIDFFDRFVAPP